MVKLWGRFGLRSYYSMCANANSIKTKQVPILNMVEFIPWKKFRGFQPLLENYSGFAGNCSLCYIFLAFSLVSADFPWKSVRILCGKFSVESFTNSMEHFPWNIFRVGWNFAHFIIFRAFSMVSAKCPC